MPDPASDSGPVIFDFRAQFAWDSDHGGARPVEEYERRFPGYEAVIRAEYAVLTGAEAPLASTLVLSTGAGGEVAEPGLDRSIAQYRLLKVLGRGGQGAVYLAEDTRLRRKVALKVLTGLAQFSPDALKRFRREAETASKLDHPGICTIYESGIDGETPFIAMRYVEGESLAKRISNARKERKDRLAQRDLKTRPARLDPGEAHTGGPTATSTPAESWTNLFLAEGETRVRTPAPVAPSTREELWATMRFFEEAALALHAAHEAGVIHRDVKPGNLMVTPSGNAVVLDFGIARESEPQMDSLTGTGDVLGTPGYMSPEQLEPRGKRIDRRTDIYSLGVALYECVTLDLPFTGPTLETLYRAILRDAPRDPRLTNRAVPRELSIVLETALEKDRDRRYVTAYEMAEDLRRIRTFEAIQARPAGPWLKTVRWVQRHPTRAIGIAAAVLVLAIGLFTLQVMREEGRTRAANEQLKVAKAQIEGNERTLRLAARDRALSRSLRALHGDSPTRGVHLDWPRIVRRRVETLAAYDLVLDGDSTIDAFVGGYETIRERAPVLAGEVLDALYRTATALDDVEIRAFLGLGVDVPRDLGPDALAEDEWSCLRATLHALVDRLESDPWRRDLWRAFRAFVDAPVPRDGALVHVDPFDAFLAFDVLASRSRSSDLERLAEFVDLARRDATALVVYDAADARPFETEGGRYAVRVYRGFTRFSVGAYEEAVVDFDAARELEPEAAPTHIGLARSWRSLDRPHEATLAIRRAVDLDPGNAFALGLEAEISLWTGDLQRAFAAARESATLAARSPTPHEVLGGAYLLLAADLLERDAADATRDVRDALAAATTELALAVDLGADPETTWREAARVLVETRGFEFALDLYDALAPRRGESGSAWLGFARLARLAEARDIAAEAYGRARRDIPDDAALALEVGKFLLDASDAEGAVSALEDAARLDANGVEPRARLAEACMKLGRPSEAREALVDATEIDPLNARARADLAWVEGVLQDLDAALEAARAAARFEPDDSRHHAALGAILERRGEVDAALDACLAALTRGNAQRDDVDAALRLAYAGPDVESGLDRVVGHAREHPGHALLEIAAALALTRRGDLEPTVAALESIAHRDARDSTALAFEARWLARAARGAAARDAARRALAREPREASMHALLATELCRALDFRAAHAAAIAGLAAFPDDEILRLRRVESAIGLGRLDEAIVEARAGLGVFPQSVDFGILLARALGSSGQFDAAVRVIDEIAARVDHPYVQGERGLRYADAGRQAEAALALRAAWAQEPGDPARFAAICLSLARAGEARAALEFARSAQHALAALGFGDAWGAEWKERLASLDAAPSAEPDGERTRVDRDPFDAGFSLFVRGEFAASYRAFDEGLRPTPHARPALDDARALHRGRLAWAARAAARAGEALGVNEDGFVDGWAAAALDLLERDLLLRERDAASAAPRVPRAEHRLRLQGSLAERDFVLLRRPPLGASWTRRAAAHFERVLDVLAAWAGQEDD